MGEQLDYLARRVAADRFFLASALAPYARDEGLNDAGLARALGCEVAALARLRLCRRPTGEAAAFRADVARIADHFGIERGLLAQIVRRADAIAGLRAASDDAAGRDGRGLLLAARDRDDEEGGDES